MKAFTIITLSLVAFVATRHFSAATELKVGDAAPDVRLQASDGKTYQASDCRNKPAIVLAWFPKAYTRGCTRECKSLAEHGGLIKAIRRRLLHDQRRSLDENKGFAEQRSADFRC